MIPSIALRRKIQDENQARPVQRVPLFAPSCDPKTGLSPGYDSNQWGPWKSHSLLLQQAMPEASHTAAVLLRIYRSQSTSGSMNFSDFNAVFSKYLPKQGMPSAEQLKALFTLFDRNQDGVLSESDFIAGMIACSPTTVHALNRPGGQLRMQFIFLFYDCDRDGLLSEKEFGLMMEHLKLVGERSNDPSRATPSQGRSYSAFYDAVKQNRLVGTSQLLRISIDLAVAAASKDPRLAEGVAGVRVSATEIGGTLDKLPQMQTIAPAPRLALHARPSVIERPDSAQDVAADPFARVCSPINIQHTENPQHSIPLRIVRNLMEISASRQIDWSSLSIVSAEELLTLASILEPILFDEDSLVHVPLPTRVYGDIHGQLPDLLQFFNSYAWPDKRKGDIISMNYVFLGDFVDRGAFSVEVIALLFSVKILYPKKVFLIRGNHEDRNMNAVFGFKGSCQKLFGEEKGTLVWERVNDCFDALPLAGLVGGEVLCIHGGIGENIHRLEDLKGLTKPIHVPGEGEKSESSRIERIVIDALWSDPTDNDKILGVHLSPRGQGACRFGPDRVEDFCLKNGVKMIIRAHECVQAGYEYFAGGRLLTVFSATSYCNLYANDAAMIVLLKNENGDIEEHAQVVKAGNPDTKIGWSDVQFRQPSPLRSREV